MLLDASAWTSVGSEFGCHYVGRRFRQTAGVIAYVMAFHCVRGDCCLIHSLMLRSDQIETNAWTVVVGVS